MGQASALSSRPHRSFTLSEPSTIRPQAFGTGTSAERKARPTRFLSLRQVLDRTSISRSLVYQLIKDVDRPFPAPVHIGRRSVWVEGEVEAYMREVVRAERGIGHPTT